MNKSEAAKKRIGNTPEERSIKMSVLVNMRWSKTSKEDKMKHIRKMILARQNKKNV